jgi:hypothetical protein
MKTLKYFLCIIIFLSINASLYAQDITFVPHDTLIVGNIGDEIIFDIDVTNVSSVKQTVFVVRTINDLPQDWYSSLCFDACFPPDLDSIATTPMFGSTPLDPGESREVSLHVYAVNNNGTAYVQLQAGTFNNPNDRITVNFTATTLPLSAGSSDNYPEDYNLAQNYPNPFNPSTKIEYQIKEAGFVSMEVYNILGVKVATVINEYMPAGNYIADFSAANLASGVYIYNIQVNNFTKTRKMILEK